VLPPSSCSHGLIETIGIAAVFFLLLVGNWHLMGFLD
jgi:hypothetical protein